MKLFDVIRSIVQDVRRSNDASKSPFVPPQRSPIEKKEK